MTEKIQTVDVKGIGYIEKIKGSENLYWGMDYTGGDLYEAEELYTDGHRIGHTRLIIVSYPEGRVMEPIPAREGLYFGKPVFHEGKTILLSADFPKGEIFLDACEEKTGKIETIAVIKREDFEDCYNLMPEIEPLMLSRQTGDVFEVLWPERIRIPKKGNETFCFRDGDLFYFSAWIEDPDYREELVIKDREGHEISRRPGSLMDMPEGKKWLLI